MKKYLNILPVFIVLLFSGSSFIHKHTSRFREKNKITNQDTWSGTVSFFNKITGPGIVLSEWRMDATINNNVVTATQHFQFKNSLGDVADCKGQDVTDQEVISIGYEEKEYYIDVQIPPCRGTATTGGVTEPYGATDGTGIVISKQKLGNNPNAISGTLELREPDASGGLSVTIYKWNLVRSIDAELIVTPQNYDNWLPEPGKDEFTEGSVMDVALKVQGRNGRPSSMKAKAFELRLSKTSKEPGMTLNAPLNPIVDLPDLRFMTDPDAQVSEEYQVIKIPCTSGCLTADVQIGSYDGGGCTTLTAVAILEDGSRIKGSLLVSGGTKEILIPKRKNESSKIGSKWLTANGSPDESDDEEWSKDNDYQGDGLSAYEEYRGVMRKGEFKRLDPNKKELGVWSTKEELDLFSGGLNLFINVSDIDVIPFYIYEIGADRRLNKNASSAHIYDQYVLKLEKGNLPKNVAGQTYRLGIPRISTVCIIDIDKIHRNYLAADSAARPAHLPYTEAERTVPTVAHELGHGVNVDHHGQNPDMPDLIADRLPLRRIFKSDNSEITRRPHKLEDIGVSGNQASGDLSCIMAYTSRYSWAFTGNFNGSPVYYEVPKLPLRNSMCSVDTGTSINHRSNTGINGVNKYFGKATLGKCLSRIKLKD